MAGIIELALHNIYNHLVQHDFKNKLNLPYIRM